MNIESVLSFSLILMLSAWSGVLKAPRFLVNECMIQTLTPSAVTLWGFRRAD